MQSNLYQHFHGIISGHKTNTFKIWKWEANGNRHWWREMITGEGMGVETLYA